MVDHILPLVFQVNLKMQI